MISLSRLSLVVLCLITLVSCVDTPENRPNFLFVISDDQSWAHTSFAGDSAIQTPHFDRIAEAGVYFESAYVSAPTCTASRSAILAGQDFFRLGPSAVLWGEFNSPTISYQQILKEAGYSIGYTGKGWGPGRVNGPAPVGAGFNEIVNPQAPANTNSIDYAANFANFLDSAIDEGPFSFWVSPTEPHRPLVNQELSYPTIEKEDIDVPAFLPDSEVVRSDLANYYAEIEFQDAALGRIIDELDERGLLSNTIIIVSSDNGMPFPRAKATNYQFGTRVPLAIRWDGHITPRYEQDMIVNLTDIAPTLLEAAEIPIPEGMNGRSLLPALLNEVEVDDFTFSISGFERHILNARDNNATYPSRVIHTKGYAFIKNFAADRWPVGKPPYYRDIDSSSPTKDLMLDNDNELLELAAGKRPAEELYDLQADPFQLRNLATEAEFEETRNRLHELLMNSLADKQDPILTIGSDAFRNMPYYGSVQRD